MSISVIESLPQLRKNVIIKASRLIASQSSRFTTLRRANTATSTVENRKDKNDHLRSIFDDNTAWKQNSSYAASSEPVGLFESPYFSNVHGIAFATQQAIQQAQIIVERICNAPDNGPEEMAKVVKNLDRLSDTLCVVIDMAEFVRNAHPDQVMMETANKAYGDLCSYMNTLNTDVRIFQVLSLVFADKSIVSKFTADEYAAATVFLRDFHKSGIHLRNQQRAEFVNLSDQIIHLGREFIQMNPRAIKQVKIKHSALGGVNPSLIRSAVSNDGYAYVPTDSPECQMILKYAQNENVRKKAYESMNSATKGSIATLEQLVKTRSALATLIGKESYADLQLEDKMAKNPNNVDAFLRTLFGHQEPTFKNDLNLLQITKQDDLRLSYLPTVNAWDRDFYMQMSSPSRSSLINMPYFSVGSVIQGLSRLFKHLYGVEFEHASLRSGEVWHEHVRKLDVVCEQEGKIGTIYCDLFSRPGKTTNAAHYTIRTSRRVDDDDTANDVKYAFPGRGVDVANFLPPVEPPAESVAGHKGLFQLPMIVLTCDFSASAKPALLSMFEVETLFHEMGHAMHSMLGRSHFHNVAGTRCASDFVELPSILMEHFAWHPKVLPLFANGSVSPDGVQAFLEQRKRFSGIEINSQILMALVDQRYHSSQVGDHQFSSVAEWHKLQDQVGLFPSVPGTMWPVQFGHLFGYGSNYYSYLFDRTLARRVWETSFKSNPLDREKGQAFRDNLLKWGGARDPWQCIADVLGGEDGSKIVHGDEEAMRTVGDWGIDV
ncbi:hypothetical protein BD408DRAFT_376091 [Parasitella parasitica]|nr:hypothetical protein BD408DRAFT_376091 [Parasitella parasitica]